MSDYLNLFGIKFLVRLAGKEDTHRKDVIIMYYYFDTTLFTPSYELMRNRKSSAQLLLDGLWTVLSRTPVLY